MSLHGLIEVLERNTLTLTKLTDATDHIRYGMILIPVHNPEATTSFVLRYVPLPNDFEYPNDSDIEL